ncbi:MAG TPA: LamG-like jellyroll fold domain-containing protein, partial [Candidatus Dormibacteraeota bacterium]|nr:LamG-like jellyroll fold domain-containing protein [Candidatus Dormibacteraeota bacterium]
TTPTLTFTSIGWSNSGDYVFIARGTGGATTSSVATVNAYSTLPAVTVPSDPISIYQPNGGTTPAANGVTHAIDRVANASYVNGGQNNGAPFVGPIGFVVAPRFGKSTVSAVRLYSADVNPQNDPADWTLEGSNDGGSSWTTIHSINFAANGLSLPAARNTTAGVTPLTQVVREIHFANSAGYTSYRVSFLHTTNDSVATALGIGEVELLGTNTPTAPLLVQQPRNVQVWPGGNPQFTVLATGFPTNLTYVWKRGGSPISGASQSSYTLLNAQVADSGATFSCTVANSNGNTNSASATLTVAGTAPTQSYPSAIITDHPVSYWRLGEADTGYPNNTVIAHDYFGGLDGTYSNAVLAATGYNPLVDTDTAATFGTQTFPPDNSYVDNIQGINFATPTNTSGAFSIETWVLNGQAGGQISGAGIVTKGFGGGGEQFALDTGAPGARFRFFVRDSSGATLGGNANGTVGPTNEVGPFAISNPNGGNWHHVVGVVDEANSNIVLYVDGISNAAGAAYAPGRGILPSPWPVTIGSRQPNLNLDYTNQFIGTIDDVAIYNYALSPAQVLNHYLAAHPLPIFTLRPTNTDFSDGGSLVLYSAAYGPSVTFQWHQSPDQSTWSAVGGQTSPTFNSPSTPNTFGPFVEVVATGSYGATTSSIVQVTVHSGAPVILQDLIPTNVVYASGSISLPVVAYGTAPVTFQWYKSADDITYTPVSNSGRISGANTNVLTISGSLGSDTGFYKVTISNGSGSVDSVHQYLLVQGQAMFNNTGLGWRFNSTENPPVNGGVSNSISGNVFTPTDGTAGENRSVWYGTPLYIGAFQASFTYQDVGVNGADGSAFVIQNQGPTALGGAGGGIGYSGITPSVALMLDIFQTPAGQNLANGGVLLDVNGLAISTPGNLWYPPGSVNIRGGNPIDVNVKYLNGIITATLRDTVANTTFTTNAVINIPSIVGANTALVGFTGSEGGTSSHQAISNFVFTPLTPLTTKLTSTNTVVLTWPALIGGYALQSTPSLSPQSWSNVANPVTQVSGQNQVIIPVSAANAFYRLSLQ